MDFNTLDINHRFKITKPEYSTSKEFVLMKKLAFEFSKGILFVRVDLFYVDGRVYYGEYTFFYWAGLGKFSRYKQDVELGKPIKLPSNETK